MFSFNADNDGFIFSYLQRKWKNKKNTAIKHENTKEWILCSQRNNSFLRESDMAMTDKHAAEKDRNESTAIRGTVAGQNMWTYC